MLPGIPTNEMNKELMNSLLLIQLNDPLFPLGAYSHSYGLETYVQKEIVKDKVSAQEYITSNIRTSLLFGDMLALKLAYEFSKDMAALAKLDEVYYASKSPMEIRIAGEKLGARLIKNVKALSLNYTIDAFNNYCAMVENGLCKGQFAIVYGVLCASSSINLDSALLSFTYAQVSGIVNNCVKLIPLSQTDGQIILNESFRYILESVKELETLTLEDLGSSTPAFDLRSMQHETLYSRLYMS